jgi:hypothetical protein
MTAYTCTITIQQYYISGADPEILHGRWRMGWLPIVNYTGARGWLVNNGGHLLYLKESVKGGD